MDIAGLAAQMASSAPNHSGEAESSAGRHCPICWKFVKGDLALHRATSLQCQQWSSHHEQNSHRPSVSRERRGKPEAPQRVPCQKPSPSPRPGRSKTRPREVRSQTRREEEGGRSRSRREESEQGRRRSRSRGEHRSRRASRRQRSLKRRRDSRSPTPTPTHHHHPLGGRGPGPGSGGFGGSGGPTSGGLGVANLLIYIGEALRSERDHKWMSCRLHWLSFTAAVATSVPNLLPTIYSDKVPSNNFRVKAPGWVKEPAHRHELLPNTALPNSCS